LKLAGKQYGDNRLQSGESAERCDKKRHIGRFSFSKRQIYQLIQPVTGNRRRGDTDKQTQIQIQAEHFAEKQKSVGADDGDYSMGQIEKLGRAVNQIEAKRHQRINRSGDNAV